MDAHNNSLKSQALSGSVWEAISAMIQRIGGLFFIIIIARFLLPGGLGYIT